MKNATVGFVGMVSVVSALGLLACGDDSDPADGMMDAAQPSGEMDASTDASAPTPPTPPPATPPVVAEPLECGGEPCVVSAGAAMLGTFACCTDDDKCGGQSPLFAGCVELGLPGSYAAETCPEFSLAATGLPLTFAGCCTPDGTCGAFDSSEGGFGCIPGDALPAMETDGGADDMLGCNYDPAETCVSVLSAYCDGPEDCSGGQQCCGQYGGGGYAAFTCEDSCVELAAAGGVWSEVCHPGGSCDQPLPVDGGMPATTMPLADGGVAAYECRKNAMYLPDFWYRCRDTGEVAVTEGSTAAGEINCGSTVCGSGEKCCYALDATDAITEGTAHCVAEDEPCTCGSGTTDNDAGL